MAFRAIIVDDEPLGRRGIASRLAAHPEIEIVASCANGRTAIDAVRQLAPDLMFLDIHMPGFDGFEVLEVLGCGTRPHIIFVTAYDQHALRAFQVHALDYLLKPIDDERFHEAIERAIERLTQERASDVGQRVTALVADLLARQPRKAAPGLAGRFVVRQNGKLVLIRHQDIDWIEAAGDYVRLHTGPRFWLLRETLTSVERTLAPGGFLRIHRSTIVNLERIRELRPFDTGDLGVVLTNGTELRASRTYQDAVRTLREPSNR